MSRPGPGRDHDWVSSQARSLARGMRMRRPRRTAGRTPQDTCCCTSQRLTPSSVAASATVRVGRCSTTGGPAGAGVGPWAGGSLRYCRRSRWTTEPAGSGWAWRVGWVVMVVGAPAGGWLVATVRWLWRRSTLSGLSLPRTTALYLLVGAIGGLESGSNRKNFATKACPFQPRALPASCRVLPAGVGRSGGRGLGGWR